MRGVWLWRCTSLGHSGYVCLVQYTPTYGVWLVVSQHTVSLPNARALKVVRESRQQVECG